MRICEATIAASVQAMRRWLRSGQGTERSLATAAGISQPHTHNICRGLRTPTPQTADRLLAAIGANAAEISAEALASIEHRR